MLLSETISANSPAFDTAVISAVKGWPLVTVNAGDSCNVTAIFVVDAAV